MMILWTTIVAPLIVGIVLIAISKLFSKDRDDDKPHKSFTMQQINITNITQAKNYQPGRRKQNKSTKNEGEILILPVLIIGLFFDKTFPYITLGMLACASLMLGIFFYTVLYSYRHGMIHGNSWGYFLLTTIFIAILTALLAFNLMDPIQNVNYDSKTPLQNAVSRIFAPSYQAIGVLLMGVGMYLIGMTQIHYLSGLKFLSTGNRDQLSYKIFYKTQRYRKPWRSVALAAAPFTLAFFFINNFVYLWIN